MGALAWGLLLFVLSFSMPAYTVASGRAGPQPQVTLVDHAGPSGALAAFVLLGAVTSVGVLLVWGVRVRRRVVLLAAQGTAVGVLAATMASLVSVHLIGALTLPVTAVP